MDSPTLTIRSLAGEDLLEVPQVPVRVVTASGESTFTLGASALTIGSGPDNLCVLKDERVSRRHCELTMTAAGVRVRDLGSKNGTWAQGLRVMDAVVPPGSAFTVGAATIEVRAPSGSSAQPLSKTDRFGEVVGGSPKMRALFAVLERAAQTDASILLSGETGTGKELLAKAIHDHSPRKDGPFVVFDCAATPPTLIESELFGYVKGAFTGAVSPRRGLLEEADRGTLFLDELGELPAELQTRLLRVLESGTLKRVGGNSYQKVNLRVVCATHRDLVARVRAQQFREDLYYRLAVIVVAVPPLRERKEDLELLVRSFLARQDPPLSLDVLPPNMLALLRAHEWPGNVRELSNTVTRMTLFPRAGASPLEASYAAGPVQEYLGLPLREARAAMVEAFELRYLRAKLEECHHNISATARACGVSRQFFYRLMERYGLQEKDE